MTKSKFYATYTGTRKEKVLSSDRVFDKATGKHVQKQVEREVSTAKGFVSDLNAVTRAQARQDALAIAKANNLKLEGVYLYKNK